MGTRTITSCALWLLVSAPLPAWAETLYIDNRIMVGLHQEKSVDSAIIKLLPSGTPLEVLKKEDRLTQVRDPDGVIGWMDNSYLIADQPPGDRQAQAGPATGLPEQRFKNPPPQPAGPGMDPALGEKLAAALKENEELQQLFKSERLKVGELQADIVKLKNELSKNTDTGAAEEQIRRLAEEKDALQKQLENLQASPVPPARTININTDNLDWRSMLAGIVATLIAGFLAGIYVLDWLNRRRHGGFRV